MAQTPQPRNVIPQTVDIADIVETQENRGFAILLFVLSGLVMLVDGFNNQALNTCAPLIIKEWKIAKELMTPVFDVSIFGWMISSIVFSMFADRVGRRISIIVAVAIFGMFTLAVPLASTLTQLTALRFIAALGVGGAMPMAISLVADYSRAKARGLMIALLYLGYTAGSSGVGLLASEVTAQYGWRSVFEIGGATAIGITLVLLIGLPESVRYLLLNGKPQARVLHYARMLKPNAGFGEGTRFVIQETAKKGVPVKHLFTEGRSAMTFFLWLALGFRFVTHFFLSNWLPTLLSDQMSVSEAQRTASLFQLGAAFSMIFGWLLDRWGMNVIVLTMVAAAVPVAAIGVVHSRPSVTMALALAAGILVLGGNIGLNAVSGMVYPTFIRSTGTGAAFAVARIGALIGPALAGSLIAMHVPFATIFFIGAAPMIAAGIFTFALNKTVVADEPAMTPATART